MSVGGRLLAACCANGGLSNNQIPTCPLATISLSFEETNTAVASGFIFESSFATHNYPFSDRSTWITGYGTLGLSSGALPGFSGYNVINTSNGNSSYSVSSNSIVTASNGPIVRPGTNIHIVTVPQYKYRSYTFTRTSSSHIFKSGFQNGTITTELIEACPCVSGFDTPQDFPELIAGPTVTNSNVGPATANLTWVGVCSTLVAGMTLSLTASGIASGPWVIEVSGGQLKLTNGSGASSQFTGTLTSVRSAINAAGFFTSTVAGITTSAAEVQDLKPRKSNPISTNCSYELYIAEPGDRIAPGTRIVGANDTGCFSLTFGDCFDSNATGLSNDEVGLTQWLTSGWFPKLTGSGYPGIGVLRSAPSASYFGFPPTAWKRTSGSSTIVGNLTLSPAPPQITTQTAEILCFLCRPIFDFSDCGFGIPSFGYLSSISCSSFGQVGGWDDCSGTIVQPCPQGTEPASLHQFTVTSEPGPSDRAFNPVSTINGRLFLG
jgi:hypothetical protein